MTLMDRCRCEGEVLVVYTGISALLFPPGTVDDPIGHLKTPSVKTLPDEVMNRNYKKSWFQVISPTLTCPQGSVNLKPFST